MEELGDKDVHLQHVCDVFSLHVPEHVHEPLKAALRGSYPQEVHLLAGYAGVAIGGGAKDQVVEDGGIGSDTNTSTDHNGHLEFVPVLVSSSERSLKI